MKFYFTCWSVCILLLTNASPLFSQHVQHATIPLNPPMVVNFKELADIQLANPLLNPQQRFIKQGEDRERKPQFAPRTIASDARNFNVIIPENTLRTVSPDPNISFNGTLDNGTVIPPDIDGAAGNIFLMETTNQEFAIYTKLGALNSVVDIGNFFSVANGFQYFDPHVAYDANHQRFIICVDGFYANGHSAIFLGISQTPDPTGDWYVYSIDATGNPNDFFDFPTVGFNNNWVVVTGNDFWGDGSFTTNTYVFKRTDLYSGSIGTVNSYMDPNVFGITPAMTMDTLENTLYMVADWNGSSGGYGYMKFYTITGTADAPTYSAGNLIGVDMPWAETTVNAPQLNSIHDLEVSDTRVNTPTYINGSLWFTHSVFLPDGSPTYAAIDWWQVDPATNDLLQFGRIEDISGSIFYFYPSISVNNSGDALLGYSVSSAAMYASSQYSYRSSADALNTMQDGNTFKSGLATYWKEYGGGRNRWGDFSATCTDPTDNSFWTFQEFANSPADNWGTVIANVAGTPCSAEPVAGSISAVFNSVCPGEGTILNLNGYTAGVQGLQMQWQQSADGLNGWANATSLGNSTPRYQTGVLNQASYFRCIVTCSNSGLSDTTAAYMIDVNGFIFVSNDTICSGEPYQLIVAATGSTDWYTTDTSTIPFFTGDTLNANVVSDTTFYISTNTLSHNAVGIPNKSVGTGSYITTFSNGLVFEATSNFNLDTVYVYPGSAGIVKVNLFDAASGTVIDSVSITMIAAQINNKIPVPLNFPILGGATYNLNASGSTVSFLYRTNSGAVYPYEVPGIVSITQAINDAAGFYYFFYDWKVTSGCVTDKFPVNVHIDIPLVIASAVPDTMCFGDSVILTGTGAISYLWQPGNVNGTVITSFPSANTTYTVVGTDAYSCTGSSVVNVAVINCATEVEAENSTSIQIYPNPTTGIFDLSVEGLNGSYTIIVLNVLGQKMMELQKQANAIATEISLDASLLPAGAYFIRLSSGDRQWMKRLLKQ